MVVVGRGGMSKIKKLKKGGTYLVRCSLPIITSLFVALPIVPPCRRAVLLLVVVVLVLLLVVLLWSWLS